MRKVCSKCKIDNDISIFSVCKRSKDGYKSQCKDCHKSYGRKRGIDWVSDLSDEYVKSKLQRQGFSISELNKNKQIIELKRLQLKLKRIINEKSK